MVTLWVLMGCATDAPESPYTNSAASEQGGAHLGALAILERASLDLRGVRPTLAEIAVLDADPATLDATLDGYLHDPRFGARVRDLFANIYLTRQDYWYVSAAEYGLGDEPAFARSVGEEPLRILSTIAEDDLPYTDIVRAAWSMGDENLGAAWPTDYPDGASGWQKVHYTDNRPTAGVLTTNGLWWRYMTNTSNANRGRANAISRILLCEDYLSKPIEFDRNINLLDSNAVNSALQTNPGCLACHATLDPIASYLWGFYYYDYSSRTDTTYYHPEREEYWQTMTGAQPAWYGSPGYSIDDLGRQIAADPRLAECMTRQVYEQLLQRESTLADTQALAVQREAFVQHGMRLRPLFASVIASDAYRAAPSAVATHANRKLMSADQLASAVEDITGFRFVYAGYDMLQTDTYGLRTLAGGVDGVYSTRAADQSTATMVLVQERLAEAAARAVVASDQADPSHWRLFAAGTLATTPSSDPAAFAGQIAALHLRIFGNHIAVDGPEVAANAAVWQSLYEAEATTEGAWADVVALLLRDPAFIFY